MTDTLIEAALRRDRTIFVFGLIIVSVLSWTWVFLGAGMGMTAVEMTKMAGMDAEMIDTGAIMMRPGVWTAGYTALMFSMWWVMMIAMMVPSAAPVLLLFAKVTRKNQTITSILTPTAIFTIAYIFAWGCFSLFATALQWMLDSVGGLSPMLETKNLWLGSVILVAAGLWQLTPLKAACLRHCRTPLGFLISRWRNGNIGAFKMGFEHGLYCLGCCWFLMILLFFGGVMNLFWIGGLAIFVLLEKTMPHGNWLGLSFGGILIVSGAVLPFI